MSLEEGNNSSEINTSWLPLFSLPGKTLDDVVGILEEWVDFNNNSFVYPFTKGNNTRYVVCGDFQIISNSDKKQWDLFIQNRRVQISNLVIKRWGIRWNIVDESVFDDIRSIHGNIQRFIMEELWRREDSQKVA